MIAKFLAWLAYVIPAGILMPFIALTGTLTTRQDVPGWLPYVVLLITAILYFLVHRVCKQLFAKALPKLESQAETYESSLGAISERWIYPAIVSSAAASLVLELVFIRWQSCFFEFFNYYKNFGMLSCFAGLGAGYALSRRKLVPLSFSIICTFAVIVFYAILRYATPPIWSLSLRFVPVTEQFTMGMALTTTIGQFFSVYSFLAFSFIFTALIFLPIGQLCGALMSRTEPLRAYSANLIGSFVGIAIMLGLSFFWTPPAVWFAVVFALLIPFMFAVPQWLTVSGIASVVALAILAMPAPFPIERIYSPYQLIEKIPSSPATCELIAAGHYHQRMLDLSLSNRQVHPEMKRYSDYYDLVYKARPDAKDVLIVGAGSGNDVSAAIRAGADRIDAVEIDPAIQSLGKAYHPEHPYDNPKVNVVINDARAYFGRSPNKYDVIVFALLDSHTLSSQASALRLDSYVYTVDSIKQARSLLKPGGVVCLSFAFPGVELTKKIDTMMTEAFDNKPPVYIYTRYDNGVCFFQNKEGDFKLAQSIYDETGFENPDEFVESLKSVKADLPTDDWPFFYLIRKTFPFTYTPLIALVVFLSGLLIYNFEQQKPKKSDLPFFFLGAGFMLVETKAITELGLQFGNTWLVTGVVIGAVLLMAYSGNLIISVTKINLKVPAYVLLFVSILAGMFLSGNALHLSGLAGQLTQAAILSCPLLFSGMIFSTLLNERRDIGAAMSLNLLGAMLGGTLEYNAMWTGYKALYVFALVLYAGALLFSKREAASKSE